MKTLTAKQAADRMGIAVITLLRMARTGKIKRRAGRTGVPSMFDEREVERVIDAGQVPRSTKQREAMPTSTTTDQRPFCPHCGHDL